MISDYRSPDMYCVVVSEAVFELYYATVSAFMTHASLRAFLEDGMPPEDDMRFGSRTRREAMSSILSRSADIATPGSIRVASLPCHLAIYFLMAHEIGHLALDHLPLFTTGHVSEVGGSELRNQAESRAVERDADAFAAMATTYLLGTDVWTELVGGREAGLRYFFVATYLLFSIMDLSGPEDPIGEQSTHPPAMVRVSTMAHMLTHTFEAYRSWSMEEAWDVARQCVRAVELATMALGDGMMSADEAKSLQAEVERSLDEHVALWPSLSARKNRFRLDIYFWARTL